MNFLKQRFSYKKFLQIFLLILTLVLFTWYFNENREQFSKLSSLSLWEFLFIFFGQIIAFIGNVIIIFAFGMFIGKKIPAVEVTKIGAHSSLVNFFGFLQGGFGVRGAYLKINHGMSVKKYLAISALQYLVLFGFAGLLIFIGLVSIGQHNLFMLASLVTIVTAIVILGIRIIAKLREFVVALTKKIMGLLQLYPLLWLCLGTLVYLAGGLITFSAELSVVNANITLGGLLVYTGVTQFTLLISITPGGLGIREGALLLVQQQMQLTTGDIVLASTLDRAVYFVTLAFLFLISLGASKYVKGKSKA